MPRVYLEARLWFRISRVGICGSKRPFLTTTETFTTLGPDYKKYSPLSAFDKALLFFRQNLKTLSYYYCKH